MRAQMSVGFGFSIGDILAVIKLVTNVIDGLRESSRATTGFRSLVNELYALETVLLCVKRLDADINHVHKVALEQAASQCQSTIDAFYKKIQRYQPHLQQNGTTSRVRDAWFKIVWTMCKQDDLDAFRAEIRGHTSSIEILLLTVQMETTSTRSHKQDIQHRSLAASIEEFSFKVMDRLSGITNALARIVHHGKALLESSNQIVQTNLRIFALVHDTHALILSIPGQVQRQQPIYLLDPIDREMPFHLELIKSKEALLAVLKINLKGTGCGPIMIDRNEFVIEDRATKEPINLRNSWDICFFPGQKVAMSMVFMKGRERLESLCPVCNTGQQCLVDAEITCTNCRAVFRQRKAESYIDDPEIAGTSLAPPNTLPTKPMVLPPCKRKLEDDDAGADPRKFRRIQLLLPSADPHSEENEESTEVLRTRRKSARIVSTFSNIDNQSHTTCGAKTDRVIIEHDPMGLINRSMTWCFTCRERRIRCDNAYPEYNNCSLGGFVCKRKVFWVQNSDGGWNRLRPTLNLNQPRNIGHEEAGQAAKEIIISA